MSPADLRRWSEEVARDPASTAFLPLADAYRRQGEREAALNLCLQGLGYHPMHVEAHVLLARLYLESGKRDEAADAWSALLRLAPDNFDGNRGMGFYLLERGEAEKAERHLARAAAARQDEPTVSEALALIRSRSAKDSDRAGAAAEHPGRSVKGSGPVPTAVPMDSGPGSAAVPATRSGADAAVDPGRIFDSLHAETPFRGAVVVDGSGLMLAGSVSEAGVSESETIGALFSEAVAEAVRLTDLLKLGAWHGMLIEGAEVTTHVTSLDGDHIVVLAAAPDAPAGWIRHAAQRASSLAATFLNGGS